ncbi:hypothetical protein FPZ54_11850 [Sphingomonas suaedae]|uniref:DUF2066 domain-containing protein n=1 Tax=Sphingomonas suaedae TaxID=2599297 RepID=A0A518RGR5_9SPHN|nr:hypothetical protein [Sphingomonas suaedae]QDX26645.1 hypothetical protein FPZ54_11850 [Sphingomonas suaedae]
MRTRWIVLLAACLATPAPIEAHPPGPQAAQPVEVQRVETRFAPPVDSPQRFRLTVTKRNQTQSWIEEVRFERTDEGYVAHWRMDAASLPAAMKHPLLIPMIRPFTGTPLAFDLDDEGSLAGVRDWEERRTQLLKSVEDSRPLILADSGADAQKADAVLGAVRAMFARLDARGGASVILKNLAPIFGWGGYALTLGEAVSGAEMIEIPLLGTEIERRTTITLASVQSGVARIMIRSEFDGSALRAAIAPIRTMVENGDPAAKARFSQSMAQLDQMTAVQRTTAMLDLATGLPRRLEVSVAADGKDGERVLIEWQTR